MSVTAIVVKEGLKLAVKKAVECAVDHRLNEFHEAFVRAVAQEKKLGVETPELDGFLKELRSSERGQEILFDAQRRVFMSSSRELGPRLIAILAAHLLNEDRFAAEIEERMYQAAERLSDIELRSFTRAFHEAVDAEKKNPTRNDARAQHFLRIEMDQAQPGPEFDGPYPTYPVLALWKSKLVDIGVIELAMSEPNGVFRTRSLCVRREYERLAGLIDRATGPGGRK